MKSPLSTNRCVIILFSMYEKMPASNRKTLKPPILRITTKNIEQLQRLTITAINPNAVSPVTLDIIANRTESDNAKTFVTIK